MSDLMEHDQATQQARDDLCPACRAPGQHRDTRGFRSCEACGTLWAPSRRDYEYDDTYPASRGHDNETVAACKVKTFASWCGHLGFDLAGRSVLEVGFGGGGTLAWMRAGGAHVSGVEPVEANRAAAIEAGVPAANIRASIAEFTRETFDFAFWLDSFEHETEPDAHLTTLNHLTKPGARAMLVLPVADSVSRRVMGRWWPHDIKDHWVFYSTKGLTRLWEAHGWRALSTFRPNKYISAKTIARHVEIKTGLPLARLAPRDLAIWLNFGERGLVFEKL